ncbi:MAG: hypothetical protein QOF85_2099 [Solirubrobacterales bacterium]|jgi:hypothetical protein|nr:hypothetical protein [Solirubrobacterales bacterium]
MDEASLRSLEREYGPPGAGEREPPDPAAAALLGAEDAIDAAQDARWHTSRRNPVVLVSRYSETGPAFAGDWPKPRDGGSRPRATPTAVRSPCSLLRWTWLLSRTPAGLWVVDLRQWELRPHSGAGVRHDEPIVLTDPETAWRRRGMWRRVRSWLFGG